MSLTLAPVFLASLAVAPAVLHTHLESDSGQPRLKSESASVPGAVNVEGEGDNRAEAAARKENDSPVSAPGGESAGGREQRVDPSFDALYRSLFPSQSPPPETSVVQATRGDSEPGFAGDGLRFGPLLLRPALLAAWISGDVAVGDTAQNEHDDYFQIEPQLGSTLAVPILRGWLRASYEPSFRSGISFARARRASHRLEASLDQSVGPALKLRADARRVWGILETTEVDPGREFFFGLGRFRSSSYGGQAKFQSAGRLGVAVEAGLDRVRFLESASFFDFDRRRVSFDFRYELGPNLRSSLVYDFEKVPAPEQRPLAASRTNRLRLTLSGDLGPLTTGELWLGYESRHAPGAGPGGERFRGLTALARVSREIRRGSTVRLTARRFTTLSAFEDDAFFVADSLISDVTLSAPLGLSLRLGAGWHRNNYRTQAAGLDRPRQDTIKGFSVGLGRPLSNWAFVRADYLRDNRDSNLDQFDTTSDSLILQLGIGFLARSNNR